jgi:hypothetical protein
MANRQSIELGGSDANLQTLGVEAFDMHREALTPEVRLQNIHEVAEEVNHRLDRFESAHFSFLQIGRAQKFNDAFALIEDDSSDLNRQLVNTSFVRLGLDLSSGETGAGGDVSPDAAHKAQASLEKNNTHDSHDAVVQPVVARADMAPSSDGSVVTASANQANFATKRGRAREAGVSRGRGFVYVQLVVATFAIAFAAPIETRMTLGRSVTGPLIVMPVLTPEFIAQRNVFESALSSVQERAR